MNVAPIVILAMIGVAVVLVTRCIDADEAFGFIEGRLLALIFGMLAVGGGLEHSGAAKLIAYEAAPWLATLPPWLVIFAVFLVAWALTELVVWPIRCVEEALAELLWHNDWLQARQGPCHNGWALAASQWAEWARRVHTVADLYDEEHHQLRTLVQLQTQGLHAGSIFSLS